MRKELEKFTNEMEIVLKENDYKRGWKFEKVGWFLEEKLLEEVAEFFISINHPRFEGIHTVRDFANKIIEKSGNVDTSNKSKKKELVDIANICMMLHDNLDTKG